MIRTTDEGVMLQGNGFELLVEYTMITKAIVDTFTSSEECTDDSAWGMVEIAVNTAEELPKQVCQNIIAIYLKRAFDEQERRQTSDD